MCKNPLLLMMLLLSFLHAQQKGKKYDFYDLSMGAVEVGIQDKTHLRLSIMEIGIPLKGESLFLSAPVASLAISPILSRDRHHISVSSIPPLMAAGYLLLCDDPYSRKARVLTGILIGPHMISNAKLTFYKGRFDCYLRQRTDFHLIDRTKIGVYSESNAGFGFNVFQEWCVGVYGAIPVLKNLPYKPQEPYVGVQVYLEY